VFSPAAIDAVPATHGGRNYGRMLKENASWLALVCVFIFAAIRYPAFLSSENLLNILRQNSMLGLVSVGMTFVILSGGIDLSVGSLVAVGGVVAAELSYHGSLAAIACGLLAGGLLGLTNGVLIARARLQPFVAKTATALTTLGRGHVGTVPVPVLLVLAAFALGALVLAYSGFGHHVFAVGDSEEAAHLLGLDVARTKIAVYTLSGVLAGAAGVLLASRLGAGQPVAGTGWEFDAIAAVVVGGTLLTGGQGGVGSTLIGLLLLGSLLNIFNLEGTISSWWQGVLRGVLLLLFVALQARSKPSSG